MAAQLLALLTSVLLLAPWIVVTACVLPQGTAAERIAIGATVGLAVTVIGGYLFAAAGRLSAYFAMFACAGTCALVIAWRQRGVLSRLRGTLDAPARWSLLALGLVIAFELAPTLASRAPIGWDPAFHAILAEKVRLANGLVHDWRPFETIPLNYPLGSHLWVVLVASAVQQAVHHVFQVQYVLVQTLASALVYVIAARLFDCWRSAVFALLLYGLLGDWGTFHSYYQWGGLPTAMCFVLFLGLIWGALVLRGWIQVALGTLLLGGIVLIHHLSAVIAVLVLGCYVVLAAALRAPGGLWQRFALVLLSSAIVYSGYLVPYALRATTHLQGTQVLQYAEEPQLSLVQLAMNLGVPLVVAGAFGLFCLRRVRGDAVTFLFVWSATLLVGYVALDYGYRIAMILRTGNDVAAFTPSRTATVLSYPLSIGGGYGVEWLRARWVARRGAATAAPVASGAAQGMWALVLAAALTAIPRAAAVSRRTAFDTRAEALGAFVREHTPEDAFVLYEVEFAPRRWLAYLTWRASAYPPIPASEDRTAVERKLAHVFADRTRLAERLAHYGKHLWAFSMAPDGSPKVVPVR